MSQSDRDHQVAKPAREAEAAAPAPAPKGPYDRDITQRLAGGATPHDLGVFIARHVPDAAQASVWTLLQKERGNAYAAEVRSAMGAAATTGDSPLGGAMLVSNNPEGLTAPGTIMTAQARAGHLAAYIHHSNHTRAPMDMYLVVKPSGGAVTTNVSGAAAATGTSERAHGGGNRDWAADPDVVVAAANQAKGHAKDPNAHNRVDVTKTGSGATPIHIGSLPAMGGGDPPLFDARFDLDLSGPAEIEVVAERATGTSATAAANEKQLAVGNTKYEESGSNGRAAGVYAGATYQSDDTVKVSSLPHKVPLTGSKFSGGPSPSVEAGQAMQVATPSTEVIAAAYKELQTSVDAATSYVLEHVFRISAAWLATVKTPSADYQQIIDETRAALTKDRKDSKLTSTLAVIAKHRTIGATLDAASYGTMFEMAFLLDNDSKAEAKIGMSFLTDATAARDHTKGAVFRGLVSVDGVEHAINHDTASGLQSTADLGGVADLKPEETKYVKVAFQSPGQISAGQELDIRKRG